MKKEYTEVRIEIITFDDGDILRTSGEGDRVDSNGYERTNQDLPNP